MYKCVALTIGYCEEHHIGQVVFVHPKGFKTAKAAVKDLAAGLFLKHRIDDEYYHREPPLSKKCCKETFEADANASYCSKCGKALQETETFDPKDHEGWLAQLLTGTCDTFGGEEVMDAEGAYEWSPWNSISKVVKICEKHDLVDLGFYSERALVAAIPEDLIPPASREDVKYYAMQTYYDDSARKILGIAKYGERNAAT